VADLVSDRPVPQTDLARRPVPRRVPLDKITDLAGSVPASSPIAPAPEADAGIESSRALLEQVRDVLLGIDARLERRERSS
jgi:hypothetical protein